MSLILMFIRQFYAFVGTFAVGFLVACLAWLWGVIGATPKRISVQRWCYRCFLRLWRVKVEVIGVLEDAPTLLVANHCSYIDVAVISALGDMRFTPKSEVKRWPVLGRMAAAFDVIFVDRSRGQARDAQEKLQNTLMQGHRICLFPEGTTNNGRTLNPFKSTLFSLAEQWEGDDPLKVQPIVIRYETVNGNVMDDMAWERIAWYGDATLIGHLWAFLALKDVRVTVHCLPALTLSGGKNRKWLAQQSEDMILAELPHIYRVS